MLSHLSIESFKSLADVNVPLGQVNVFVGANGAGKSNLLEAVGVLGAAASGRVDDESLQRRGVRSGVPRLYKSAFPEKDTAERRSHIKFSAQSVLGASYEITLWNPIKNPEPAWKFKTEVLRRNSTDKVFGRSPAALLKGNPDQGYAALKLVELSSSEPAAQLVSSLRDFSIFCANTPTLRGLIPDAQTRVPVGLSGGRLPEGVQELLRSRSDNEFLADAYIEARQLIDWAKSSGVASSALVPLSPSAARSKLVIRFTDRFMSEGRNILSGYDASEGSLFILFAAVLALHPQSPPVFAIDNFDQAINPKLASSLMTAFCHWMVDGPAKRQALVTCHNPATLDGLPLQDDRVRLFAVDRDNRGRTVVKRVEVNEQLQKLAQEGWSLSRLWMSGLIGGVPSNV